MAQYYKTKEFKVDEMFMDYFYINDINNYEALYIINNSDFNKIFNDLEVVSFENKNGSVSDNNPIYLNLKMLNNADAIYLKEKLYILNDDNIKSFIIGFRGIILCEINLVSFLKDLNLIKEEYKLNKNTYLKIDKYGKCEVIVIN